MLVLIVRIFSYGGTQRCQPIVCSLIHISMLRCLSIRCSATGYPSRAGKG